ncbi:hypothetical protein D3C86_1739710 [compost metagenome]
MKTFSGWLILCIMQKIDMEFSIIKIRHYISCITRTVVRICTTHPLGWWHRIDTCHFYGSSRNGTPNVCVIILTAGNQRKKD